MEHIDYTFTLEVRDVPGMLVRITQVFARRGCNIQSLKVKLQKSGPWSIIDIDAYDIAHPDQIQYQLEKLVDVNSVAVHHHTVKG
jgi:acetolactate synthase small subunit